MSQPRGGALRPRAGEKSPALVSTGGNFPAPDVPGADAFGVDNGIYRSVPTNRTPDDERINAPFLVAGGSADDFRAGIERAIALGWLWRRRQAGFAERGVAIPGPGDYVRGMEKPRIKALRQAQLYGYLIDRTDRLYYPGGSHPLCSVQTAQEMVRAGWLLRRDGRYEITPAGLRVLEPELPNGRTRGS